jgi:mRNA interferase MazF
VTAARYTPDRGDVVWLEFSSQAGREQRGKRPGLVLSPAAYNGRVGLAVCCPVTSQVKGYPFEVAMPPGLKAQGAILADHVRSLDWKARGAKLWCRVPPATVEEVVARLQLLLLR